MCYVGADLTLFIQPRLTRAHKSCSCGEEAGNAAPHQQQHSAGVDTSLHGLPGSLGGAARLAA